VEIFRTKFWSEDIQTEILEWKYSEQNFGLKIFRPKYWPENIQTKTLA
jgi:hypothetical protein